MVGEGHGAAEDEVVGGDGNPVACVFKLVLVGTHQVDVQVSCHGVGDCLEELDGGDAAGLPDFVGGVDLLRQDVLVIVAGGQVVVGLRAIADADHTVGAQFVGVETHGVAPYAGVIAAVGLHLHFVSGGRFKAGEGVRILGDGGHGAVHVEVPGRGVAVLGPTESGEGGAEGVDGQVGGRGAWDVNPKFNHIPLVGGGVGCNAAHVQRVVVGVVAIGVDGPVGVVRCAKHHAFQAAFPTARVIVEGDEQVALAAVFEGRVQGEGEGLHIPVGDGHHA